MPDPLRVFDLVRVRLSELHEWLAARGLVVCEPSVNWGRWDIVEVRDGRNTTDAGTLDTTCTAALAARAE